MIIALRRVRGKSGSTLLETCAEYFTECMRISVIGKVTRSGTPLLQRDRSCGRGTHRNEPGQLRSKHPRLPDNPLRIPIYQQKGVAGTPACAPLPANRV